MFPLFRYFLTRCPCFDFIPLQSQFSIVMLNIYGFYYVYIYQIYLVYLTSRPRVLSLAGQWILNWNLILHLTRLMLQIPANTLVPVSRIILVHIQRLLMIIRILFCINYINIFLGWDIRDRFIWELALFLLLLNKLRLLWLINVKFFTVTVASTALILLFLLTPNFSHFFPWHFRFFRDIWLRKFIL